MVRPNAIVQFERFYLGGWAIGLLNTILNWSTVQNDPNVIAAREQIGSWYLPTITALGLLIPLVLWYFIARRGSVVAKWIMVVFTALGVAGIAIGLATGGTRFNLAGIAGLVGVALNIVAATTLFRPETRPWFGEETAPGDIVR